MIRIACCADLQLDAHALTGGLKILDPQTGLNQRLIDTWKCWDAFCSGAIVQRTDLQIMAGDVFEHPKPTPTENGAFIRPMNRLLDSDCNGPTLMCSGNHDQPFSLVEDDALEPFTAYRPQRLKVFTRPGSFFLREAGADGEDLQVFILPYPRKAAMSLREENASLTPQEISQRIAKGLEAILDGFRAEINPTVPSLLVAHLHVTGSQISEAQPQVAIEVPMVHPSAFRGFTFALLGHIHKRQEFRGDDYHALYPGSLDRRDFGEEREEKSWSLVTLENTKRGWLTTSVDEHPLPARVFRTVTPHQVLHWQVDDDLTTDNPILRVKGRVTPEEAEAVLKEVAGWPLPVANALDVIQESRARDSTMTGDLAPEKALRGYFERQGTDGEELAALMGLHHDLAGKE